MNKPNPPYLAMTASIMKKHPKESGEQPEHYWISKSNTTRAREKSCKFTRKIDARNWVWFHAWKEEKRKNIKRDKERRELEKDFAHDMDC